MCESRRSPAGQAGFTLVELLVVFAILGILAAISVPAFYSQRDKALDGDAKVAAQTAATALESYATDHDGSYVGASVSELRGIESSLDAAALSVDAATSNSYQLTVTSDSGNTFTIALDPGGARDTTCTADGDGGCGVGGLW